MLCVTVSDKRLRQIETGVKWFFVIPFSTENLYFDHVWITTNLRKEVCCRGKTIISINFR